MRKKGRGRERDAGEAPENWRERPSHAERRPEAGRPDEVGRQAEAGRPRKKSRVKQWLFILFLIVAAFAAGFGWQYTRAESLEGALEEARREVAFTRLEATLAAATFQVYRGAYEPARQLASDFFTGLQSHVDAAPVGARPELLEILAERDRMITLLSRGEPESRAALAGLYARYRATTRGTQPPDTGAGPANTGGGAAEDTPGGLSSAAGVEGGIGAGGS